MKNITLSLNEELLQAGREYAQRHRLSLNTLVRRLLEQHVVRSSAAWLQESFTLMDRTHADSRGKKWKRGDLYRG